MLQNAVRDAARSLVRSKRFCLAFVLTLSLAMGAAGSLVSLVHAVIVRPIPVANADRLVAPSPISPAGLPGSMAATTLQGLAERLTSVERVGGFSRAVLAVALPGSLSQRPVEAVTGSYYGLLAAQPFLGRLINESDAAIGERAEPVVVLSYTFWRSAYGADPGIVGRTVEVEGVPLTVIGISAPSFSGLNADVSPDVVIPLGLVPTLLGGSGVRALHAIGRLRDGASLEALTSEATSVWPELWTSLEPPTAAAERPDLRVQSLRAGFSDLRPRYSTALVRLTWLASLLVILAVASVGTLCLARGLARRPEFYVRLAVGAQRRAVAAHLAAEALVLGLAAGLVAILLSWWGSRALADALWTSTLPMTMRVVPGGIVLSAIVCGCVAVSLLVALPVYFVVVGPSRRDGRGDASRVSSASGLWQRRLLVPQVALAFVLMVAGLFFVSHLVSLRRVDPGYVTSDLWWARLAPVPGASEAGGDAGYLQRLLARVSALPGVGQTALSVSFPTTELRQLASLPFVSGSGGSGDTNAKVERISPGFLETAGLRLLQGRGFDWQDTAAHAPVALINRLLAARLFPGGDAVGQSITIGRAPHGTVATVAGVVSDASPGDVRIDNLAVVYRPLLQALRFARSPVLLVRTRSTTAIGSVAPAVNGLARHYVGTLRTVTDQIDRVLARERVLATLSAWFAMAALLVAATGLYGSVSYLVEQRSRELGIRMAVGASRVHILGLVVRHGVTTTLLGVALGLPLAVVSTRLFQGLLEAGETGAGGVLAASLAVILCVCLAACARPAYRASRIELGQMLRQ